MAICKFHLPTRPAYIKEFLQHFQEKMESEHYQKTWGVNDVLCVGDLYVFMERYNLFCGSSLDLQRRQVINTIRADRVFLFPLPLVFLVKPLNPSKFRVPIDLSFPPNPVKLKFVSNLDVKKVDTKTLNESIPLGPSFTLFVDGACSNAKKMTCSERFILLLASIWNPSVKYIGNGGYGCVLFDKEGKLVETLFGNIDVLNSSEAEFVAAIKGMDMTLKYLKKNPLFKKEVKVYMDCDPVLSTFVLEKFMGSGERGSVYLRHCISQCRLHYRFESVVYCHCRRAFNKPADLLATHAKKKVRLGKVGDCNCYDFKRYEVTRKKFEDAVKGFHKC